LKKNAKPPALNDRERQEPIIVLAPPSTDAAFVAEIEELLKAADDDIANATRRQLDIGRKLNARKEQGKRDGTIPHGEWLNWLERNFPPRNGRDRVRRLQHYMQAADAIDTGDEATKTKLSSFLPEGIDAVLDEVRRTKQQNKPRPAPLVDDVEGDRLRILIGDCRERLKELPDKSVHMVATSPPYFGLRCYDVEPTIWGGELKCEHVWGEERRIPATTHWNTGGVYDPEKRKTVQSETSVGASCSRCRAWRGALGLEPAPALFVEHICEVSDEVWRVLRDDGTAWIVIGDSFNSGPPGANPGGFQDAAMRANPAYNSAQSRKQIKGGYENGLKPKDLIDIPGMVASALRARGWYLRSKIIWAKKNTMPESVTDRPTKSYETILLLTKQPTYYYDNAAIKEPAVSVNDRRKGLGRIAYNGKCLGEAGTGQRSVTSISADNKRNARDVWSTIANEPFAGDHFAPFPKALVKPIVMAGTSRVGCCSKCGAPWKREVERRSMAIDRSPRTHPMGHTRPSGKMLSPPKATTIGWSPSCSCNAGVVPCTVLDPFAGTGTTGLVANALGRKAVLIEANPKYAAMAQQRIDKELRAYTAKAHSEDAWGNPVNRARERKPILIKKLVEWDGMMVAIYVKKDRPRYVETKPSVAG
jgi:DNA modification methylase